MEAQQLVIAIDVDRTILSMETADARSIGVVHPVGVGTSSYLALKNILSCNTCNACMCVLLPSLSDAGPHRRAETLFVPLLTSILVVQCCVSDGTALQPQQEHSSAYKMLFLVNVAFVEPNRTSMATNAPKFIKVTATR